MTKNSNKQPDALVEGFNVIAKPIGPVCNLDCQYCYYTEKHALFPQNHKYRMSDEVLEVFIKDYIESQSLSPVPFIWQGGEPTLLGLDFFRKVVHWQNKYARDRQVTNSLQTNGTLLDDTWCEFLVQHNFLVGISLDGPEDIHNTYRVDYQGKPSFQTVMSNLDYLHKHRVEFNVLCCVARHNEKRPLDVYQFFKEQGVQYIQFIPVVERQINQTAAELGLHLAVPGTMDYSEVTEWSAQPSAYGDFLIKIFNQWVSLDVGTVFIMNFEWALSSWINGLSCACTFSPACGKCIALEHNGDVYTCDHYVYPDYYLGNILNTPLEQMLRSEKQVQFGKEKQTTLSKRCRKCDVLFACYGDCPKHRFVSSGTGPLKISYLCPGYKRFFKHIDPYMKTMKQLIMQGRPVCEIMKKIG